MQRIEDAMQAFLDNFNTGNLDGLMSLYEADAALIPQPEQVAAGTAAIREALRAFLALKGRMEMKPVDPGHIVQGGNLALVSATWSLTRTGPDDKPVTMGGTTTDVLRRQSDGTWRWVIDVPFGIC